MEQAAAVSPRSALTLLATATTVVVLATAVPARAAPSLSPDPAPSSGGPGLVPDAAPSAAAAPSAPTAAPPAPSRTTQTPPVVPAGTGSTHTGQARRDSSVRRHHRPHRAPDNVATARPPSMSTGLGPPLPLPHRPGADGDGLDKTPLLLAGSVLLLFVLLGGSLFALAFGEMRSART